MEPVCTVETMDTTATVLLALINAPWAGTLLSSLLGALSGGIIAYLVAKTNNNCTIKIKKAELLFNQKVTTYYNFLRNAGVDIIAETDAHLDILNSLSCVELIADDKLYEKCQSLVGIFIGICDAEESSDRKKRDDYAKQQGEFMGTVKKLMRAEIKNTLGISSKI